MEEKKYDENQFLTFMLGGEVFGIGILHIKEIIEYGGLTFVPMMPPFIRGVINLRGNVVPVIDMSVRFGQEQTPITKKTCIVIIEAKFSNEKLDIGVLVDSVNEVIDITPSEIEPPPSFGTKIQIDFIYGMGKIDGKFIILLNVNKVLSTSELAVIEEKTNLTKEIRQEA
ncbi:MAG: chemotaxis protein CheW [Leptospiraceae bacterium]|nr:purine-binding chemotaxis protein CheW [Leptospiraceae bacterium]MCK6381417.1 chemotaxis protein CheW [Leptospiraceae bacterium]NUM41630.1 purine-binding chemotaxis protein CheW [Leptospiraceae bacterium]